MIEYWYRRQRRKQLREALSRAKLIRRSHRDLLDQYQLEEMERAISETRHAFRDPASFVSDASLQQCIEPLDRALQPAIRERRFAAFCDNFEVLLVAIAVAMAFRAYFFQPFKIPTGSMQPTLYGIHSVDRRNPAIWDRMPLKPIQWVVTGSWHRSVRIRSDGDLREIRPSSRPGYTMLVAAGHTYYLPSDASARLNLSARVQHGLRVRAGDLLWAGDVISGDHVFVNRMSWNFRRPRRGEVMVFATDGIADLQAGTHYIKRLSALPGDTLSINPPDLLVDGRPVDEIPKMERIANKRRLADWAPPYEGYKLVPQRPPDLKYGSPMLSPFDSIRLAADEYFGIGDNTGDSLDSRYFGPVPERNLVGPAVWMYWPFLSPRWGPMR